MSGDQKARDFELARQGDQAALDRALSRVQHRLIQLSRRYLGSGLRSRIRPSDLLQSSYLEVVQSIQGFRGDSDESFIAWVSRILRNHCRRKNRFFQAARRKRQPSVAETSTIESNPDDCPQLQLERIEALRNASEILATLPEAQRTVFLLRTVEKKEHREIAELMQRSESATRMLLSRARAQIAQALERSS